MNAWFVAYTQPNREQVAAVNLVNQGFEVYLPRYRKRRRHARRIEEVLRPLFSRYIFVRLDLDMEAWRSVNGTRGVKYLVTNGTEPLPVPEDVLDELRHREVEDGIVQLVHRDLRQGERLQLVDGAFSSAIGIFECMVDKDRVMLLLELLGRQVRVQAPVQSLAPVI